MSCAAPEQGAAIPAGVDTDQQAIVQGKILTGANPVHGAYVRLLDATGEFTAEVVTNPTGDYRFYAAPGTWTVRALHRTGNGGTDTTITHGINNLDITLS
jgi:hypothetical protein